MADFTAYGPIELRVTLGEVLNAAAIAATGFWVARIIERREANQRANKDLVVFLCRECLECLTSLSQVLESNCLPDGEVPLANRNKITRGLQRLSNSIYAIERASEGSGFEATVRLPLESVKQGRELLRTQITDPLAEGALIDAANIRQIEGTINQARQSLIDVEIAVNKR